MPDEQTETSHSALSGVRFKGRLTKGCRTLVAALAVVLVVISGFVYWVLATLNPDIGLGGLHRGLLSVPPPLLELRSEISEGLPRLRRPHLWSYRTGRRPSQG